MFTAVGFRPVIFSQSDRLEAYPTVPEGDTPWQQYRDPPYFVSTVIANVIGAVGSRSFLMSSISVTTALRFGSSLM